MEPRLEVVPEKLLLVLGPSFASDLVRDGGSPSSDEAAQRANGNNSTRPPFSYDQLAQRLITAAKTMNADEESAEEDPSVLATHNTKYDIALEQAVKIMGKNGAFAHWLQRTFITSKLQVQSNELLEKVLALQRDGALVAYSSMDDVVARSAKQNSLVLAKDGERWARGERKGILHLFGVYDAPDSVRVPMEPSPACGERVRAVLRDRTCVLVGFHAMHDVPLVRCVVQFLTGHGAPRPLWLVEQQQQEVVHCADSPESPLLLVTGSLLGSLCSLTESSKGVGKLIEFPPVSEDKDHCLSLLLANKSSISQVSGLVSNAPGVNFVLVNPLHYRGLSLHSMALRIARREMAAFWQWLISRETLQQLVNSVVLAVVLRTGFLLWLNGKQSFNTGISSSHQTSSSSSTFKPPSPSHQPPSPPVKKTATVPRYILEVKRSSSSQSTSPINPYHQKLLSQLGAHEEAGSSDHPFSGSMLKRRLSLPYTGTMPQAPPFVKVKPTQNFNASPRHQLLLSKYIFGRNNKPTLKDSKTLKHLLKTEVKSEPKTPSSSDQVEVDPAQYISQTRAKRRRALYLEDNTEWSSQMAQRLKCKMKKWEKQRQQRRAEIAKREGLSQRKTNSVASLEKDTELKQQLTNPLPGTTSATMGNMFLPQTANVPSMVYPYISTYPFITNVPVNPTLPLPYVPLLSQSQVLPHSQVLPTLPTSYLLMSHTSTTTTSSTKLTNGDSYHTPILASHLKPSYPTVVSTQAPKRPAENSRISSLLQSDSPPQVKKMKKSQNVLPAVNGNETSRREKTSSTMSVANNDSGRLSLWQFLLELLLSPAHNNLIRWTGVGLEFHISKPQEVASLWRSYQQDESLDYAHFVKALKYYCNGQPVVLVPNETKTMVYRFSTSFFWYIHMRCGQLNKSVGGASTPAPHLSVENSKEVLVVD